MVDFGVIALKIGFSKNSLKVDHVVLVTLAADCLALCLAGQVDISSFPNPTNMLQFYT